MISDGCNILQVVKVNVKFVHERHFPGFEVATEVEIFRESNTKLKDRVKNVNSSLLFINNIAFIKCHLYNNPQIWKGNTHKYCISSYWLVYS